MNAIQSIVAGMVMNPVPVLDSWHQHNCPACAFRGHARGDQKKRGNHMFSSNGGFSYNCYNCGLKINWMPGRYVSSNFELLLRSFHANEMQIMQLKTLVKNLVLSGEFEAPESTRVYQNVQVRELPSTAKSFAELASMNNPPKQFLKVLEAVYNRNRYLTDLELYWSPDRDYRMYDRFIVPYYMNGKIIGYTARHIDKDSEFRYYNQVSTSVLYNFDLLNDEHIKVIFVAEGPLDAALMCGVSINNHTLGSIQIEQLKQAMARGKKIVIVPDRDKDGMKSVKQALENGFSVAFPNFGTVRENNSIRHVKDFEEATAKFGRVFCLQLLHDAVYDTAFDIELHAGLWF